MEKQPLNSILDQFINSHEQTYEEFLGTFTYLLKDEVEKKSQASEVDSLEKTFSVHELPNRNKESVLCARSKESSVSLSSQPLEEDQVVMSEGFKVGFSKKCDLSLARRVKVDNYLALEDLDTDEESGQEKCIGSLVLPGEVEQTVAGYTPYFDHTTHLKVKVLSVTQPSNNKTQEFQLLGDEVYPFSLDEEFDYDNVALTPKFSEAEMKSMIDLSEQKKRRIDFNQMELKNRSCTFQLNFSYVVNMLAETIKYSGKDISH
uniref:Intraflagellar transport associated protein n=1 Tax=Crocodylus porosus TaxID=8502 RepID=A0A7M4EWT4_CROPO